MPGPPLTSGSGAQVRLAAQFCAGWSEGTTGHSMPARPGAVRLSVWEALQGAADGRGEGMSTWQTEPGRTLCTISLVPPAFK